MHSPINAAVVAGFCLASIQAHAAITQNDLSGLPALSVSNPLIQGFSLAPLPTGSFNPGIAATFGSPSITISEQGPDFIGFGPTVPIGTDLTLFTASVGNALSFDLSNPSDIYHTPFYQQPVGIPGGVGYLTFNYNNAIETLTLISSTVQDTIGESLIVGVPEPTSASLGALGLFALLLRRR